MKKTVVTIGLNDQDTKFQVIDTDTAKKTVTNLLIYNCIDGATITDAVGVYRHESGVLITENSIQVTIFDADMTNVYNACKAIKNALNQESVVIENLETNTVFF